MRPKIGVDIDGTVADFVTGAVAVLQRDVDPAATKEQWTSYDMAACYGQKGADALHRAMSTRQFWHGLPEVPHAEEMLVRFAFHYDLVFITQRYPETAEVTRTWLVQHEFPFDDIVHRPPEGKTQYCLDHNIVALVDDEQSHCEKARAAGLIVAQFSQPYNRGGGGILRCDDWRGLAQGLANHIKHQFGERPCH